MITILKSVETGLETQNEFSGGSWVSVIDPSPEDISRLHHELGIPTEFLIYPLDLDETARVEKDEGLLLIVLRIPCFQGENVDIPYTTIPLGIILTEKLIITVCRMKIDIVPELLDGRIKRLSTAKRNRFILQILMSTATKYLRYLREINRSVDALEDRLQASMRNQEVLGLLKYEKSLVYFTTALRSNELMLERLQRSQMFKMYPEDEELLEDVLIETRQAIEMTNIANNILASMMDAFASIISNNLNVVMKFLTSVTIVLTIPGIFGALYGMNVRLPLMDHPAAFFMIVAGSVGLMALTALIFVRRNWF